MPASVDTRFALYPGSFDPFTYGHLDILKRALRLFERIEVTVAVNAGKSDVLFTPNERCRVIRRCTEEMDGVTVTPFEGLLVEHARNRGAGVLLRGLRQVKDFDYEFRMAFANRKMHPDLETVFLMTSEQNAFVSSTIVRDVYRWGGDLTKFVPPSVVEALREKREQDG